MKARFPLALPFAVLASLVAGCSSSSGSPATVDGGTNDSGIVTHHDAGGTDAAGNKDSGTAPDAHADAGKDTGVVAPPDGGTPGVMVPADAKSIATGIIDVAGMTTDDYIVYFDTKGGVSVSDISGNVTQIAPGPATDAGVSPEIAGIGGNVVAILTDYTTKTVDGNPEPIAGTLSIWSHTLGTLTQIATGSTGIINIATDGSYVAYSDSSNATGTEGNIGIVAGTGTGGVDVATNVSLDLTAALCFPFALFDGKVGVISDCAVSDGGTLGSPSITAYDGTSAWAPTVLTATAGPSSLNAAGELVAVNEATDSASGNALIVTPVAGTVLSSIPLGGTTATVLTSMFGAPTGGEANFYITPDGTAAYFTNTDGSYGKSTFATPGGLPTTTTLAPAGSVFGVQVFSSDGKYDVDYGTANDTNTMEPTSLNVRDLSTGVAKPLIAPGSSIASTFGTVNGFTADNSYVIFTADLTTVGENATAGNLSVAPVTTGVAVSINPSQSVWNANPLTGTKLIYNVNYIPNPDFTSLPNGAATADMYIADATVAGPGTLFISGADAPNYFYVTADKSHMFFTFTQLALPDGATEGVPVNGDGLYSIALP